MAEINHSPNVTSARQILGAKVYDLHGHKIGYVEDVAIDGDSQTIVFATVVFGGFLGVGGTHHPVPWIDLDYDASHGHYIARLTKQELRTPAYD